MPKPTKAATQPVKEHSAGIITYRQLEGHREYLILHYPSGHFDFPKGHIEGQETQREAAMRELTEETGITQLEFIEGYREMMQYQFRHNGKLIHKDVVYFLGSTEEYEIKISHEHQDFKWLPYDEAVEQLTFDNAKNLIKKAEDMLKH